MPQQLTNSFGKVFLTIHKDDLNKWIYVNWIGYLTEENVKAGAAAYTLALANAGFNCVLNDTRHVIGSWNHSLNWVLQQWSPNAAKAGLKHFAMITTPETFADSTAATFYAHLKAFQAQVFDDVEIAKQWLWQYSLKR